MIQNFRKPAPVQNPLLPPYWIWKAAIPDYLIQCLDYELEGLQKHKGGTFATPGGPGSNPDLKVRDTDVMMFDPIHWFSGVLFNLALSSNCQAEWNFSILAPESLQIAFYGPGQHYDWHEDSVLLSRDDVIRKISVICMLSDSKDYEGGKLEFEGIGEIKLERGDVVVFPSFIKHRVTPVTEGDRKTAVIWVSGYRSW